jgi:hypothetical protein
LGGDVLVLSEAQYDEAENYRDGYLLVDGTVYVGDNATAFADLEAAARSSQLSSSYASKLSSAAAVESAKTGLEDAVAEVYVAENDAFEVAGDLAGGVVVYTETAGSEAVEVDATDAVDMYKTEANKDAATKEVFTLDITGTWADDDDIFFDDVTVSATGADIETNVVDVIVAESFPNWDVAKTDANTVTFTAKVAEDVTLGAPVVTITGDGAVSETVTTDGVDAIVNSLAAPESAELAGAIEAAADFDELVALFEEARDLNTGILAREEAVADATAAIENDTDDADAPGLGLTLVDFASSTLTAESEVILFEDAEGTTVTFGSFGAGGEDQIYFGEGYSLVQIPTGDDINDNVGDAGALEVLWSETAGTLTLYAEAETFGGNSAGTADVTTIVLTGVEAADITFEGGFLSAGTAA